MNRALFIKQAALTQHSTEVEIGAAIDRVRQSGRGKHVLTELLHERNPVYKERPGYQITRIKGYAMASFAITGLPHAALGFVLDELQNGRSAYMVAAAARALRGAKQPGTQYVIFLLHALCNIRYHDDSMSLEVFKPSWPLTYPTTARKEIFLTFQWLRGYAKAALPELQAFLKNTRDFDPETIVFIQKTIEVIEADTQQTQADCCDIPMEEGNGFSKLWKGVKNINSIAQLEVENEKGIYQPFGALVGSKPAVVAFFYTRCMNPNKCTLTINKLGWLQQELIKHQLQEKVNLLAFTYDPAYDSPARMQAFGENRGVVFGPHMHMLRTKPQHFAQLSHVFQLGVNHVASSVNQHRLELFLIDQKGNICTSYTRLQWEVQTVLEDVRGLLAKPARASWFAAVLSGLRQVVFPLLLAFFPKCPVCWAAYLSAFGISGLQRIPYSPWLIPWIIVAIGINLFMLYRRARVRNSFMPFWISLLGGLLIIGPGYLYYNKTASMAGVCLIMAGALLNSVPFAHWFKRPFGVLPGLSVFKRH